VIGKNVGQQPFEKVKAAVNIANDIGPPALRAARGSAS
jgi:hypothetical protein